MIPSRQKKTKKQKKEQPLSSDHEKSVKKAHEKKDVREIYGECDTKTVRNTELCLLFPREEYSERIRCDVIFFFFVFFYFFRDDDGDAKTKRRQPLDDDAGKDD